MAFAVAGLAAREESLLHNAEAAVVSFPGFFDALSRHRRNNWTIQSQARCRVVDVSVCSFFRPTVVA
jgi:hypothetical protein